MSEDTSAASRFSVMVASDTGHEKLYAEIYCDEKFVALVSQERGLGSKILELPGPDLAEDQVCREVDLEGFLRAVQLATRTLAGE